MSSIADLIADEGLSCYPSQSFLNQLAGELLHYRDEGAELSPRVLFCTDVSLVFRIFPGAVHHVVGTVRFDSNAVKNLLKDCAPLATRSWNIFVQRMSAESVKYGVFSYIDLPKTLRLEEAITLVENGICLLMQKIGASSIELRGAKGSVLNLAFSTIREEAEATTPVPGFAKDCCSDLPQGDAAEEFRRYFSRLVEHGLASCHGTMLACACNPVLSQMEEMKDGIALEPRLDLYSSFEAYRSDESAESIIRLQSAEQLFFGILQCDGILMFDTRGALVAYRVFYKPSTPPRTEHMAPVGGGSRRRAFESAKAMVGPTLKSLLFRSQDGLTLKQGGE